MGEFRHVTSKGDGGEGLGEQKNKRYQRHSKEIPILRSGPEGAAPCQQTRYINFALTCMSSDSSHIERYISDNCIEVTLFAASMTVNIQIILLFKLFGLADRSIIDYVLASGMRNNSIRS